MISEKSKIPSSSLWQHPYVDVFKHFKVLPIGDWKANKKQGDIQETFVPIMHLLLFLQAKEIGRKAVQISGSISANNFIQIPHPNGLQKSLNLTGRYIYLEVKSPNQGNPFNFHFDFGIVERSHNIRLSVSNLFKNFNTSNGFAIQVPLELQSDRWTFVVLDLFGLMKRSQLFPPSFNLEGCHSLKSMTLCANVILRGVYTSDNLYHYTNLPSDLKFKFSFPLSRWEDFFGYQQVPTDWDRKEGTRKEVGMEEEEDHIDKERDDQRKKMSSEIDQLLGRNQKVIIAQEEEEPHMRSRQKVQYAEFNKGLTEEDEEESKGVSGYMFHEKHDRRREFVSLEGLASQKNDYVSGSYIGVDLKRSAKLNQDPIMELKHIVGYSAQKCLNLKWSKFASESVVIFTSGGTIIAMDVENNNQKRFFFGHSEPICCFDINANGTLLASAQEGSNSIIRIWEYASCKCISVVILPVNSIKCLAFSFDGKYLACAAKDKHNRELIIVWDITKISLGQKPDIVAKQTSDFNIISLKFSPIDSERMASCGKENIRVWRIKNNGTVRGSAVVLNHHARNSVFTSLDFEYGFRSSDPQENEKLKRFFVGSKHGMVFQINYHNLSLEATYQTNDSAIYSIAVNEAFCVTGSEDTYLRVWPLDFSEFFMEAKHEGTVCAVDISSDGLKVVCGTMYGSLGILDKSNQRYRTLLRSHTDEIISMDFHLVKKNIITVSRDKTIRLWDVYTFDQVYEFSSPIDQALCVSAHPHFPLFSCGFETGIMRVFDIERTCVADEFTQFNKPLTKLAYSPNGDFLVTCCQDGGVAIHNANRQHLPIKMMHLEFPPQYAHVAFSKLVHQAFQSEEQDENQNPNASGGFEAKFAVMGEYGNNVNVYETQSFLIKHAVQVNHLVRSFQFANNNRDLLVITTTSKLRVYSLIKYEGVFLREISTVHRGNIVSHSVSNNNGYLLTGGEDHMIKVWDYEADKPTPFYFQTFIGHIYPPNNVIFNPVDNSIVVSAGEKDGLYFWKFYGDTQTQFVHQDQLSVTEKNASRSIQKPLSQPTVLEKLRTTRKEMKTQVLLSENSFILPNFKALEEQDLIPEVAQEFKESVAVKKERSERNLDYNHFSGSSKQFSLQIESQEKFYFDGEEQPKKVLEAEICTGYDGFGGVHDNLVWNVEEAWMAYTLHNKVILENTKTRQQSILINSSVQLSCLAYSLNKEFLAAAEGETNPNKNNSLIYLYKKTDSQCPPQMELFSKLMFHQKGVQTMAFSNDSKYLISVAIQGENVLAVWDIEQGLVIKSALIRHNHVNSIKVDPYIEDTHIQFSTVGSKGSFTFWRLDLEGDQFQNYDVVVPQDYAETNFTSIGFTQFLEGQQNTYLMMLGSNDGSMTAFDQRTQQFVDSGIKKWCISGEIGLISCKNKSIVIASSTGTVAKYPIENGNVFPQDNSCVRILKADSSVVSLQMDAQNNEGILGTSCGTIYYISFPEKVLIKLVTTASFIQDELSICKFNIQNPQLFLTNQSPNSNVLSLWATKSLDQVLKLGGGTLSPVRIVLSNPLNTRLALVGHANGVMRVLSLESLKVTSQHSIRLSPEEELVCGVFNSNGINFALGTNLGSVFFGSLKEDTKGKSLIQVGKLDNVSKFENVGIASLQFSSFDPIGSFLVAFENGQIKTWQSSTKNEQLMKFIEVYQQQQNMKEIPSQLAFDMSECGYQQFDLLDTFDMFENPHGEELTEEVKNQLALLYSNKKYKQCGAAFAPGTTQVDLYFSFVSALQYIYIRNYLQRSVVRRVSLMAFPTCLSILDFSSLSLGEEGYSQLEGGENVLAFIGTKEGQIQMMKISSVGERKIAESKAGLSFGPIQALDVNERNDKVVASNQTGEIFVFDYVKKIFEE